MRLSQKREYHQELLYAQVIETIDPRIHHTETRGEISHQLSICPQFWNCQCAGAAPDSSELPV